MFNSDIWLLALRGHRSLCHSLSARFLSSPCWLLLIFTWPHSFSVTPCTHTRTHTLWWQTGSLDTQQFSQWEWLSETRSVARMTIFIISKPGMAANKNRVIPSHTVSSVILSCKWCYIAWYTWQLVPVTSDLDSLCGRQVGSQMFTDHKRWQFKSDS